MVGQDSPKITQLDELLEFRETTERISQFLDKRLRGHLSALSPLLAPARVFGKHVGGRESATRADEAMAELAAKYQQVHGLFDLKPDLDETALASVGAAGIQIFPYEYGYQAQGAGGTRRITMTSPVRWVVTYASDLALSQVRNPPGVPGEARTKALQRFVVNALAFQIVLNRNAAVAQLLNDLRYETAVETLPELDTLPLAVFSVQVPSFRPADDLLFTAVRLSGVPAFIELIDMDALRGIQDPLRLQIEALLGQ